jgi:hypothetical protein
MVAAGVLASAKAALGTQESLPIPDQNQNNLLLNYIYQYHPPPFRLILFGPNNEEVHLKCKIEVTGKRAGEINIVAEPSPVTFLAVGYKVIDARGSVVLDLEDHKTLRARHIRPEDVLSLRGLSLT